MIFTNILIQNFLGFRTLTEFPLKDQGLVLIEGANGAGKSSIYEAIVWCLFGKTVRGYSADEVINRKAKKDCLVSLYLEDNGAVYSVHRFRKHASHKNEVLFTAHDPNQGDLDLSQGTPTLTQQRIVSFLGIDFDTFVRGPMLPQGSMKRMSQMTDAEQKAVLDTATQMSMFAKAKKTVEVDLAKAQLDKSTHFNAEQVADGYLNRINIQLDEARAELNRHDTKQSYLVAQNYKTANYYHNLYDQTWESLSAPDEEIAPLVKKLSDHRTKLEKLTLDHNANIHELDKVLYTHNSDLATCLQGCKDLKGAIEDFEELKQAPQCPTCEQPVNDKHADSIINERKKELKVLEKHITDVEFDITQLGDEKMKANVKFKEAATKLKLQIHEFENELVIVQKQWGQLGVKLENLTQYTNGEKLALQDFQLYKTQIGTGRESFQKTVEEYESQLTEQKKARKEARDKAQKAAVKENHLEFLQEAFSNSGIKSQVLDSITPYLNDQTNEYCNTLTEGRLEVTFNTKKKLKSGETREKFSITVDNKEGAGDYKGNSGGEKSRADVAINLAMSDLIAHRASKSYPQRWFDEPFENLDEDGVEAVMELLTSMISDCGTIFLVSHKSDLKSLCQRVINLAKSKNGTIVTNC